MVYQENTHVIVMTTKEVERGRVSSPPRQTAGDFYLCVTFVKSIKQDNGIIPTQAAALMWVFFGFVFIDFDYGVLGTTVVFFDAMEH